MNQFLNNSIKYQINTITYIDFKTKMMNRKIKLTMLSVMLLAFTACNQEKKSNIETKSETETH